MKPRDWRPAPRAEDRLLGVLRLEKERLAGQDGGFAALLEEAARTIRALVAALPGSQPGVRVFLADELDGAAIVLRARKP